MNLIHGLPHALCRSKALIAMSAIAPMKYVRRSAGVRYRSDSHFERLDEIITARTLSQQCVVFPDLVVARSTACQQKVYPWRYRPRGKLPCFTAVILCAELSDPWTRFVDFRVCISIILKFLISLREKMDEERNCVKSSPKTGWVGTMVKIPRYWIENSGRLAGGMAASMDDHRGGLTIVVSRLRCATI